MSTSVLTQIIPGQRFGRWTVLGDVIVTSDGKRKCLCRCDCGTELYVLEHSLRYGGSESCGCLRKEKVREALAIDLTGQIFGELTVLRPVDEERKGGVWWLCKCSCGAEYKVQGTLLINGKRTCCPSKVHKRNYASADISGKKFGRLTALYPTDQRDSRGYVIWHCRCDCGNEVDITYNALMYSHIQSCGCQRREKNQVLHTHLQQVDGTSVDLLKSTKIPKNNTTGVKGVYLIRGKYVAKIVFQKKQYILGSFDNLEEAAEARRQGEEAIREEVLTSLRKVDKKGTERASMGAGTSFPH